MALAPAITDLEQLKSHPALACLLGWNSASVEGAKFDREEMTIYVGRAYLARNLHAAQERPDAATSTICRT